MNDEINKLLREKGHWDDQIKALGGPDYKVFINNILSNSSRKRSEEVRTCHSSSVPLTETRDQQAN